MIWSIFRIRYSTRTMVKMAPKFAPRLNQEFFPNDEVVSVSDLQGEGSKTSSSWWKCMNEYYSNKMEKSFAQLKLLFAIYQHFRLPCNSIRSYCHEYAILIDKFYATILFIFLCILLKSLRGLECVPLPDLIFSRLGCNGKVRILNSNVLDESRKKDTRDKLFTK